MENKSDNIIVKLIVQHRTLQSDLGIVADEIEKPKISASLINESLRKFSADLEEHLKLENDYFYVELIKQMKASGQNTVNTEAFIAEMGTIGVAVKTFLGKYSSASSIDEGIDEFIDEFASIVETLNMRIEVEETGVYLYWK